MPDLAVGARSVEIRVEATRAGAGLRPLRIVTLTEALEQRWNTYVSSHPGGTFFHTTAWRNPVRDVFGHRPIYLAAERGGHLTGLLPLLLVRSQITGPMLVSVPYGVGGGILADDEETVSLLWDRAGELADEYGCVAIDLRSERALLPDVPVVDRYVGFDRELPSSSQDVLGWLPRKARAAARNARFKYGLAARFGDQFLPEVWRLYTISMRRLGSLAYPYRFFEELLRNTPGRHWVTLVRWDERPVAGLVTFLFRDRVMPYFFGATDDARRCSAANFVYLTVMERGVAAGYRIFDFGRSRRENTGSFNFKRFNGFEPRPLGYQLYTRPGHTPPDLSPDEARFRLVRWVWPHLPLWLTRGLGARLARHIPG